MNMKRLRLLLTSRRAVEKQERGQLHPVSGPLSCEFMGSRGALRQLRRYALGTPALSLAPFWSNYS